MKMTFANHYKTKVDERREFIIEIAKLTLATETTVTRWINGEFVPSRARQEIIANYLQSTPEELWPSLEKPNENE